MTQDRGNSPTPTFHESCSEEDGRRVYLLTPSRSEFTKGVWSRIGKYMASLGLTMVIVFPTLWAITGSKPLNFAGWMVLGNCLWFLGYMLHTFFGRGHIWHAFYGHGIKEEEDQESEVGQTSARATNATVLTSLIHPHNELDENLVSNAYRSNLTALSTNYNMANKQPQSSNSQRSSAVIFNNSQASDHSRQQPVVSYTLLDNTRDNPMTQDVNGSQLQHPTTVHTVLDIHETSVPEPHSGSVNHEVVSTFHTEHHTRCHLDNPQRQPATANPLSLSDSHHHVVPSDHLASPSQERQRVPSPGDDAPPSYDAVMKYSDLYRVSSL